ncbi:MAG: biliverdin-producing heme oxygenase [Planctomycetota bacterium]
MPDSLLDQLRQATRPIHDRLHDLDPTFNREAYARFLAAMAAGHGRLAARGQATSGELLERLEADLDQLPKVPREDLPAADSDAGRLGELYVMTGSRMGSAAMLSDLRKRHADWPMQYLAAAKPTEAWPELKETLAQSPANDAETAAAVWLFEQVERRMRA